MHQKMDWKTFDEIVATVNDPMGHFRVVGKNIIFNRKDITSDIASTIEAYKS